MTPNEEDLYLRYRGVRHCIVRAKQRYGIDLDEDAVRLLQGQVTAGKIMIADKWRTGGQSYLLCDARLIGGSLEVPLTMDQHPQQLLFIFCEGNGSVVSFCPIENWKRMVRGDKVRLRTKSEANARVMQARRRRDKK